MHFPNLRGGASSILDIRLRYCEAATDEFVCGFSMMLKLHEGRLFISDTGFR